MKKIILLSTSVLVSLLALVSVDRKSHSAVADVKKQELRVACLPASQSSSNAVSFVTDAKPFAVTIRKNVYSLSPAEISSIKTGIANMKALPYTNPTSWTYQAAIHGTTLSDALPSWNSCHQAGASFFFLAWHRMYCYFFERILRAKSGDPNLTLPYWNYQTNATLHPDYRSNAVGNPLYDGSRSATINSGGSLPASISTSIDNALINIPYYDFQSDINGPHGSVHISIGGNMGSVSSAAQDPIFWLHHCNIDRLWEAWLRKCESRRNPDDAPWLNKSYTFFDETGTAVSMTGTQIVNTVSQLNYRYDFVPLSKICLKIPKKWYVYKRWPLLKWPNPYVINKQLLKRQFSEVKPDLINNFMKERKKSGFNFTDKDAPDKLIIEVENVKVDRAPEGVVEVYLNLPANENPSSKSKSFVGLLDLFSVSHANLHHDLKEDNNETKIELNASRTARALGLSIVDLKKAEISFFVRGNTIRGRVLNTATSIQVKGVNLAIELAQK
jgi:Common central domain of tyrosinase/Polyphenol oxidase middle domain